MDDKKKEELREIADEFDFLRQLIRARLDHSDQYDSCERNRNAELIAGRIIAARQGLSHTRSSVRFRM